MNWIPGSLFEAAIAAVLHVLTLLSKSQSAFLFGEGMQTFKHTQHILFFTISCMRTTAAEHKPFSNKNDPSNFVLHPLHVHTNKVTPLNKEGQPAE